MELDCQSCGACCAANPAIDDRHTYVRLSPADLSRLDSRQKRLTVIYSELHPTWRAMQLISRSGRRICAALEGEIGENTACGIYANRPGVCRDFEKGDELCFIARAEAGLSVPNQRQSIENKRA